MCKIVCVIVCVCVSDLHRSTGLQSLASRRHHVCEGPGGRSVCRAWWDDMTTNTHTYTRIHTIGHMYSTGLHYSTVKRENYIIIQRHFSLHPQFSVMSSNEQESKRLDE